MIPFKFPFRIYLGLTFLITAVWLWLEFVFPGGSACRTMGRLDRGRRQPGPSQLLAANAHEDVGQPPIYWLLKEQALIGAACPGAWSHNHSLRFHNCVERETWKMHSDQG